VVVSAGEFKAKCLKMMDDVQNRHLRITVTKRGKPVAELVPIASAARKGAFGVLAGTVTENGDIIEPTGEAWEADA